MKPILFNTEMVKAILDGRKSVTRRIVKELPVDAEFAGWLTDSTSPEDTKDIGKAAFKTKEPTEKCGCVFRKPLCEIGDILYVRETWKEYAPYKYMYKADGEQKDCSNLWEGINANLGVWSPSIHMPTIAARIFLLVTNVRVERLQDITVNEIKKEGALNFCSDCTHVNDYCGEMVHVSENCSLAYEGDAKVCFHYLWDSTIDMKNHWMDQSWGANPWVWVIEFERISKEDAYARD